MHALTNTSQAANSASSTTKTCVVDEIFLSKLIPVKKIHHSMPFIKQTDHCSMEIAELSHN
jgi:hypothetical protein